MFINSLWKVTIILLQVVGEKENSYIVDTPVACIMSDLYTTHYIPPSWPSYKQYKTTKRKT